MRTGAVPTDQWETALTSPAGWNLGRHQGGTQTEDAAAAGTPAPGVWVEVTLRTDQNGDTSVWIDGTEVIASTNQGGVPASGSIGLRTGLLPPSESWYVDDVRARRLVTQEPTATLGPLDRN